ncbi:MAG TPA: glycosyltransferase [Clostridiales bacterium]|nr:glycosyltransferase [Clostridiales bacterium]
MIIDIFIPTYKSDDKLNKLLKQLYKQSILPRKIYILHTQEYEGQIQKLPEIHESNIEVLPIKKENFDHGGTRGYGASLSDADIYMFMTQDAIPADEMLIENLIKPFSEDVEGIIAATFARQLSNKNDKIIEKYTRTFNYPNKSRIKSHNDLEELGIKTYFCSNVCSAYKREVYNEMGGFVTRTIFNEDMIMAFDIINNGYSIAYVSDAKVIHSHKYSYIQQFTRNFDLGVSHNEYSHLFNNVKSESEGIKLVKNSLKFLIAKKKYYLIPDLIINSAFKLLGYKLGRKYDKLPKKLVLKFSMNKNYWI